MSEADHQTVARGVHPEQRNLVVMARNCIYKERHDDSILLAQPCCRRFILGGFILGGFILGGFVLGGFVLGKAAPGFFAPRDRGLPATLGRPWCRARAISPRLSRAQLRAARAPSRNWSDRLLVFRRACEKHGLEASFCADAPQFLLEAARVRAVAEQPQHDTSDYFRRRTLLLRDMVALCSRLARMGFDAVKPATLVARSAPVANNFSQPVFPRMEVCSWTAYRGIFHPVYQDFALAAQCSHDGMGLDMSAMSWSYV